MKLFIETPEQLWSKIKNSDLVCELHICADVAQENNLEAIFKLLLSLANVKELKISDDYLLCEDENTKYFCSKMKSELKNVNLTWCHELKIDGQHGR